MKDSNGKIGIVILAAGASKRLGKPKQLLVFEGETLLKRAVKTALASGCRPVIIVLGAETEKMKSQIEEFEIKIIENPDWQDGMGTSIQIGVRELSKIRPDISGAVLMVCDQPFVSVNLIARMVEKFRASDAPLVACSYGNTLGVPALFSRRLFPELLALNADKGAKKVIYEHLENVIEIPFEAGAIDVDTEQDYLNLIKFDTSDL